MARRGATKHPAQAGHEQVPRMLSGSPTTRRTKLSVSHENTVVERKQRNVAASAKRLILRTKVLPMIMTL